MSIFFTLCSNNYLAQAKTLGDSLLKYNPGYQFIIGLVDESNSEIDYHSFEPYTILLVADIGIPGFDTLWKKYTIVEFNTSVKASYFKYIFKQYPLANTICYLDPDISVYDSLKILENAFTENDILLTPHITRPINLDDKEPGENTFLNYGLYNLGFIGVHRNCTKSGGFLDWWESRTLHAGFHDAAKGFFVDQLWINFVPLFYERIKILKEPGFNVAPWNLHERKIMQDGQGNDKMSNGSPLYFYHFSNFNFKQPEQLSAFYTRYNFNTHPELKKLYLDYCERLIKNGIEKYSLIKCKYSERRKNYLHSKMNTPSKGERVMQNMKSGLKLLIPPVILKIKNRLR